MAFEVQDEFNPTATANANISVAVFDEYMESRGYTNTYTEQQKQSGIVLATDYLDIRFNYKNCKKLADQSTEHPRRDYFDDDGRVITNGTHPAVFLATAEYTRIAVEQVLYPNTTPSTTGQSVTYYREKIDGVEEETHYGSGGAINQMPSYPIADNRLIKAGLVVSGNDLVRA